MSFVFFLVLRSFHWEMKNFDEAEIDCVLQGGHLASIHSQAENDALRALAGNMFIGLRKSKGGIQGIRVKIPFHGKQSHISRSFQSELPERVLNP